VKNNQNGRGRDGEGEGLEGMMISHTFPLFLSLPLALSLSACNNCNRFEIKKKTFFGFFKFGQV